MELETTTSETTVATTTPTSSVDVDVAQATSHPSTVQLTEDIITKVINAPVSVHQDNVSATHAVNLTSNMDMSTAPLPGMSTFTTPMTPPVEAYQPSFQRLGGSGVPGPQFQTPDITQNVFLQVLAVEQTLPMLHSFLNSGLKCKLKIAIMKRLWKIR